MVGRHRSSTPATLTPAREMFGWMIVLAPTIGILLSAASEASANHDTVWAWVFWIFTAVTTVFYFYVAKLWVSWLWTGRDFSDVDRDVDCWCDDPRDHHHPGEH